MKDRVVFRSGSFGSWTIGLIAGSLVGGTIALLMAPQSGGQTRTQLAQTSGQVRGRAKDMMGDARSRVSDAAGQARSRFGQVVSNMGGSAGTPSRADRLTADVDALNRQVDILESDLDKKYDE